MNDAPILTIGHTELTALFYRDQPVITLAMMDQVHERPEGTARKRFNDHKEKLIEGEDFFKVCASEIRTHKIMTLSNMVNEDVTFLTGSGYLMLVKSFTDDLAWQVQRQLVKGYFRIFPPTASPVPALPPVADEHRLKYEDLLRRCYAQIDKTECFAISVREGLRDQICDLLTRLGREEQAARFRDSFQVHPPFQRVFWETFEALEAAGAKVNHSSGGGLIAINIRQFQRESAKFGYSTYPEVLYRKYLPYSEKAQYLGEQFLDSRISRNSVACLLFRPWE